MEASRWGAFYAPYVGLRLKPLGPPTACSFGRRFVCVSLDSNRSGLADTCRNRKVKPGSGEGAEEAVDRGLERGPWEGPAKKRPREARVRALQSRPFTAARPRGASVQDQFFPRCSPKNFPPQSRDTPPKRDTGIASEKDWGINLLNENVNESGTNKDGSTWYRESGEDLGENGYRCRWAIMGGRSQDGSSEWRETWWEKADWTGYKELGVEKSGKNAEGDSWWETWKEVLYQDEWRWISMTFFVVMWFILRIIIIKRGVNVGSICNLARIERSAQKQAKSGNGDAGWYEKWWEKYDAKGWTEKGAHKYGRLNDQSWWEKWGEQYDGTGSVLKWTDKWAETELGTKWGDKWEDKFFAGIGARQGETWHVSPSGDRKCINMVEVRLGKAGTLWWRRKPIMRLNHITDGLTQWGTQHSCCRSSLRKGLPVSIHSLILDHPLHQLSHQSSHLDHRQLQTKISSIYFFYYFLKIILMEFFICRTLSFHLIALNSFILCAVNSFAFLAWTC